MAASEVGRDNKTPPSDTNPVAPRPVTPPEDSDPPNQQHSLGGTGEHTQGPEDSVESFRAWLDALIKTTGRLAANSSFTEDDRDIWHQTTNRLIAVRSLAPNRYFATKSQVRPKWPWAILGIGSFVALTALVFRTWGVLSGVVYGEGPVRYFEGILVAGVLLAAAGWLTLHRRNHKAITETLSQALALVASLAGIVALTGIFAPESIQSASLPACPAARTYGANFAAAAALPDGVNVRAEPRITAAQLGRYPADCLIGFDKFCIGDPIVDTVYAGADIKRMDARWLRVARHDNEAMHWLAHLISGEPDSYQYIAAGVMHAQPRAEYNQFKIPCIESDPGVTDLELRIDNQTKKVVGRPTTKNNPVDLQYSIYIQGAVSIGRNYRQVPSTGDLLMNWDPTVTARSLVDDHSPVVITAAPCLGPSIPPIAAGLTWTVSVDLAKDGSVIKISAAVPGYDENEAAAEACKAIE